MRMGMSRGLSQMLSLLSQCFCWAVVIIFTLCLLQQQADGLYLYTVIGLQACLLVCAVLAREVANQDGLITWSLQCLADPVLSCLALTPLVLIDKLPGIAYTENCLSRLEEGRTDLSCLNHTLVRPLGTWANSLVFQGSIRNHQDLQHVLDIQLVIIGLCLLLPAVVGVLYYKPWLPWRHQVFGGVFWILQAVDAGSLLHIIPSDPQGHTAVAMSLLARGVFLILATGFVLSSPLLLVSLMEGRRGRSLDLLEADEGGTRVYGELYIKFAVILDLTLWELPDLAAKSLIISRSNSYVLPTSFYCSMVKNLVFIIILVACVFKLFLAPKTPASQPKIPPEFSEPIGAESRDPMTVTVDVDGVTSRLESVTSAGSLKWEKFLVIYGLVSCLVLVGSMISVVCLYTI